MQLIFNYDYHVIDFNGISTRLELFHSYKVGNHVQCTVFLHLFVSSFLKIFITRKDKYLEADVNLKTKSFVLKAEWWQVETKMINIVFSYFLNFELNPYHLF